jgi:hypothetical protein
MLARVCTQRLSWAVREQARDVGQERATQMVLAPLSTSRSDIAREKWPWWSL